MTTPLPPLGPGAPDERLPGEAELAALYRQLPQNEPGPALDAAVLRAAAQALEPNGAQPAVVAPAAPAGSTRKFRPRWLVGLSSAAALVLAAGLAWRMHESPRIESAPVANGSVAPVQAEGIAAASNAPAPPAPAAAPPEQAASLTLAAAPPARMAARPRQIVAEKQAAPAAREEQRAGATQRAAAEANAPADSGIAAKTAQPVAAEAAAGMQSMQATMVAVPAPPAAAADTTANTSDTPAQELDKIRQLFVQGHDDEALQRLAAFRLAHPQWKLPPELQATLRQP
ncbi:hypothetical protein IMW82_03855 [Rhodanobacter sp. B2A1Ga4]|uniref:hypothetical protein n=1 Tax=Rhodanobacter sp. B2A1Ga4 TaxID=2778647 RepID=UPI001B36A4BA|nr:hypothetical protein [Rhodanobacter sp. B2A1Ga4]MBQ4853813.1 hypothetical protein [Rhodanobacter sp. B2A1Ga4]